MPSDCSSWWYIVIIKRTFSPTKRGFLPEYIIFFGLIFPNFVPMPFHAFVGLWLIFHLEHNLPPPILCLWLFYLMRWKKNTNEYYYSLCVSLSLSFYQLKSSQRVCAFLLLFRIKCIHTAQYGCLLLIPIQKRARTHTATIPCAISRYNNTYIYVCECVFVTLVLSESFIRTNTATTKYVFSIW